jgi:superoxide dismutase, Fe-Mn family
MFTLPELSYDYAALEPYIDEQTMHIHHDKHHAAYVKNLNDTLAGNEQISKLTIDQLLSDLSRVPENIRTKVKNNGGGHYNHSFFWQSMASNPKGALRQAQGDLSHAIDSVFGSFEKFTEQFSSVAASRFGSGWAWLVVNKGKLEITDTANQDNPLSEGKIPILCLDVWEHAYYLKYKNLRADYIKNWWNVVNWKEVARRFEEAVQ